MEKKPARGKKPDNTITPENVDSLFNGGNFNIGVLLGNESGGLVDLDLDWPEARTVASVMFNTFPVFGRPGARSSHRLVRCRNAKKSVKFQLPTDVLDARLPDEHALVVLEVRANGHTMFPPSIHPNGENVTWEKFEKPQEVEWSDLRKRAGLAAFLSVCIRFWPGQGCRDDAAMALAGVLLKAGLSPEKADEATRYVARQADDEEYEHRGKAERTAERLAAGEPTTGMSRLLELMGLPKSCLATFREWLELPQSNSARYPVAIAVPGNERGGRREITYLPSELVRVVNESEQALIEAGTAIYQMSGRLVRPIRLEGAAAGKGTSTSQGALVLREVTEFWLKESFMRAADYYAPSKGKDGTGLTPTYAPIDLARHYIAREGDWQVPVLRAVVEAPTLRFDGSLIQDEGYDADSGLLIDTRGVAFPQVPDSPTEGQAFEALALLKDVFRDFPFDRTEKGCPSRSVALSAVLTALCRRTLRTAPMHAFSAPTMGTGKSLLADIVSLIATGRTPACVSQGKNDEEEEKRLLSILMQGDGIIVYDNVERPIQGDALCSILTQEAWQSRQLGSNKQVRVLTNALFLATGNNLVFKGDMTTRAIMCRLDAKVEAPETRRFDRDLRKEVPRLRPQLVSAGLTILRAFIVAGRPGLKDLQPFGRFEDWSDLVRGALVWLGEADPCDSREHILSQDPEKEELFAVLDAWKCAIGVGGPYWTASEIIIKARSETEDYTFLYALESVCRRGLNARSLGRYLAKFDGRIVGGLRLSHRPDPKKGGDYRVEQVVAPDPQLRIPV